MFPKHLIVFLLFSISIIAHASPCTSAVQKPPCVIISGPSSLNITHLLAYKHIDTSKYQYQPINRNTYQRGDTTFHSFAFSLQEEWQFALRGYYNLARLTAESSDVSLTPGLIWVQEDQLYVRLVTGTPLEPQMSTFSLGTVKLGKWHVVSVLAKWGVEGNGDLQLWVDGEKVLEKTGVDTIMDDGRVYRFESCRLGRCLGV
ncbi:hypothetical protein Asppvi_009550 [Aspergillus pseudoviridinutans]|uniref:Concanavalin A-like lectin/glucanase domain-containing protein n=1 Tax=Aspergillus pseudoviridinutans TaxID=1517512 RepID=A0A9P3BHY6_9EURO|nr:uncharacterized protein Asppvi_009550 [Aspergillus pseudoviridinutans]GIJ90589.1 hypothetical protein Asppvi_009550 [Aspergillus pseudoviridinutans]